MNENRGLWRGKRVDNGEWITGYYMRIVRETSIKEIIRYCIFTGVEFWNNLSGETALESYEVDPSTLGECTGLRDKNGNLIFEGDVFRFDDEVWSSCYTSCGTEYDSWEVKNCGVVGFDEEYARFDFVQYQFNENSVEADLHENRDIEFAEFVSNLEIAGNIHDNPELLKGGK